MIMTHAEGVQWDPKFGFKILLPSYEFASKPSCNASTAEMEEKMSLQVFYYPSYMGKFIIAYVSVIIQSLS